MPSRLAIALIPAALLSLFHTGSGAAQTPDVRIEVTLVRIPFVATDANGKRITDLRSEELSVIEDGVKQDIKYLWTELDLPLAVGLVVDISSSQMGFVRAHQDAVQRFINHIIGPSDRILIATVDEQPGCSWISRR